MIPLPLPSVPSLTQPPCPPSPLRPPSPPHLSSPTLPVTTSSQKAPADSMPTRARLAASSGFTGDSKGDFADPISKPSSPSHAANSPSKPSSSLHTGRDLDDPLGGSQFVDLSRPAPPAPPASQPSHAPQQRGQTFAMPDIKGIVARLLSWR